jgi:hypothetical protein
VRFPFPILLLMACSPPGAAPSELLSGELEVLHIDRLDGTHRNEYRLVAGDARIELHPEETALLEGQLTGDRVSLRGRWLEPHVFAPDRIEVGSARRAVVQDAVARTRTVAAFILHFGDEQPAFNAERWRIALFTGTANTASTASNLLEQSFGLIKLQGLADPARGDFFGPYVVTRVPGNPCPSDQLAAEALAQARAGGLNPDLYDRLLFAMPPSAGCGYAGIAHLGGRYLWCTQGQGCGANPNQGVQDLGALPHELLHNEGSPHSNAIRCANAAGAPVPLSGQCEELEYGDSFDVMGSGAWRHMNAWQKARIGLLRPVNRKAVTASGSYPLVPIERESLTGAQALQIRAGNNPNGTPRFFYVDYRQPSPIDNYPESSPALRGVMIRLGSDWDVLASPRLIDTTPSTQSMDDAPLLVGETFFDPVTRVKLSLSSANADAAMVQVELNATLPLGQPPSNGTGLRARYLDGEVLDNVRIDRVDAKIGFDLGGGQPDPRVTTDRFIVHWTGEILPRFTGSHLFSLRADDFALLTIDDQLVVETDAVGVRFTNAIMLTAGQRYRIRISYIDTGGDASLAVGWSQPGLPQEPLPTSQLFPAPVAPPGNGIGLRGEYFANESFAGKPALERIDAAVDFDWRGEMPAPGLPSDNFSVRWTGHVVPLYSELYAFVLRGDDRIRLFLDDQLLIEETQRAGVTKVARLPLIAGKRYAIRVELAEVGGDASMHLRWSSANTAEQVIPASQLIPTALTPVEEPKPEPEQPGTGPGPEVPAPGGASGEAPEEILTPPPELGAAATGCGCGAGSRAPIVMALLLSVARLSRRRRPRPQPRSGSRRRRKR